MQTPYTSTVPTHLPSPTPLHPHTSPPHPHLVRCFCGCPQLQELPAHLHAAVVDGVEQRRPSLLVHTLQHLLGGVVHCHDNTLGGILLHCQQEWGDTREVWNREVCTWWGGKGGQGGRGRQRWIIWQMIEQKNYIILKMCHIHTVQFLSILSQYNHTQSTI